LNSPPIEPFDQILAGSLPPGPVAATTHLGPYHLLGQAHDAILQWCNSNGRQTVRPCWETYGHWQNAWTHDPSRIRTDVYYLLKN
jgi:effector-binding domain-containing protein